MNEESAQQPVPPTEGEQPLLPMFTQPSEGEQITSTMTWISYTIGQKIGEGAFSFVYNGQDSWGNGVAVKVLKPTGTYDAVKQNALDEFQKLLTVRHPCITHVHDAFEFRNTFYIVTELCHEPIRNLFNLPSFDGQVWLKPIARCVLQALHFLHVNNIAHTDIHLGNVLSAFHRDELLPSEVGSLAFKVTDLGIAKFLHTIDPEQATLALWMRPPEVLDPKAYGPMDRRVDFYHTGLLLLSVLLGRDQRFTETEILEGKPRQIALEQPAPFNFALEKMLRRHAAYRTATALEAWRDLESPAA